MSAPVASRERWINAGVLLLGVVFFGALGVGVVSAPMKMHPALGWLLRGFIVGMFGSLAGGALVGAVRTIRPPVPPAALLARCLGCGEPCAAEAPCPVCALPPMDRAAAITASPSRAIDAALLSLGASSLLCLGAFVAVGPWIDGERRAWVLCAMAALAVLLLLVGGAGVVGGLVDLVDRGRRGRALVARWSTNDRWLSGDGHAAGARVTGFDGNSERRAPLTAAAGDVQGYRDMRDDSLAETLATLQSAGLMAIVRVQGWRWSWREGGAVERAETRGTWAELADVTRWREGGCYEAAANAIYRGIEDGAALEALRDDLRGNPTLRSQWDAHAAALREAGVTTTAGLVAAVAEALREPSTEG